MPVAPEPTGFRRLIMGSRFSIVSSMKLRQVSPITFRVWLSRQCKTRPAVNGTPFTWSPTPLCRLRRTPEGRARRWKQSRSSTALGSAPRQGLLRTAYGWLEKLPTES